jgi:hypothetical protein
LGKHEKYIAAVIDGKQRCSIPMAVALEEISAGRIKAVKLRPDLRAIAKKVVAGL